MEVRFEFDEVRWDDGGELDSLLDELKSCEKRRKDLRAVVDSRERVQGQQLDRQKLEASVRRRVESWRGLLARRTTHGRQLRREMLAGPSGTPLMVPVRGYDEGWNLTFAGLAA